MIKSSNAFTLIEMLVTITIIALLTGFGIANLTKLRSPEELLNQTNDLIISNLNRAYAQSLLANNINICPIKSTTNNQASCDYDALNWSNINGNRFNPKLTVQVNLAEGSKNNISSIQYKDGNIDQITYTTNSSAEKPSGQKITFTTRIINNSNLCGYVTLWLNGITEISNKSNYAC